MSAIERYVDRLSRRVLMMLGFGIVTGPVNDSGPTQSAQIQLHNLELRQIDFVYQFGFSSSPPPGTAVVAAFLGGDRSNGIVIGTHNAAKRATGLLPGEAIIYDANGNSIKLTQTKIIITAPIVELSGDLHVKGAIVGGFGTSGQVGLLTHSHDQGDDTHSDAEQRTTPPVPGT